MPSKVGDRAWVYREPATGLSVARETIATMPIATAHATIVTNHGPISVELYGHHAPKTVKNFIGLASGTLEWTHPGSGTGGPGYQFDDEISPELDFTGPYVLAMANAGTRGGRGTNGSQFFITVGATTWLQGKHTIFGRVVGAESQAVVDAIAAVPTGGQDRPLTD